MSVNPDGREMVDRPLRSLRSQEAVEMAVFFRPLFSRVAVIEPLRAARRVEHIAGRVVVPGLDFSRVAKGLAEHVEAALGEQGFAVGDLAAREFYGFLSHFPVPARERAAEAAEASSPRSAGEPAAAEARASVPLPLRALRRHKARTALARAVEVVLRAERRRRTARQRSTGHLRHRALPLLPSRRLPPAGRAERDDCGDRLPQRRSPPALHRKEACSLSSFLLEPVETEKRTHPDADE
ncbi:hypothetical protein ACVMB2_006054 [Sinorhizobium meliloti]